MKCVWLLTSNPGLCIGRREVDSRLRPRVSNVQRVQICNSERECLLRGWAGKSDGHSKLSIDVFERCGWGVVGQLLFTSPHDERGFTLELMDGPPHFIHSSSLLWVHLKYRVDEPRVLQSSCFYLLRENTSLTLTQCSSSSDSERTQTCCELHQQKFPSSSTISHMTWDPDTVAQSENHQLLICKHIVSHVPSSVNLSWMSCSVCEQSDLVWPPRRDNSEEHENDGKIRAVRHNVKSTEECRHCGGGNAAGCCFGDLSLQPAFRHSLEDGVTTSMDTKAIQMLSKHHMSAVTGNSNNSTLATLHLTISAQR